MCLFIAINFNDNTRARLLALRDELRSDIHGDLRKAGLTTMDNQFTAEVNIFERDKGWHYVCVPTHLSKSLEYLADRGLIAVTAKIGNSSWPTSLLPMGDGTHFIALPAKVRSKENATLGAVVDISFDVRTQKQKPPAPCCKGQQNKR